jgi:simple sugar transport system substrate-binding protein
MKLKIIMALALAASLVITGTAFAQKKPHIIVVTHGQVSDSFWLVVKNGVDQAAKDTGAQVDYRAPGKFDMVAMAQLIDAAVASKPDGLVVSIPDADALGKPIQAAVKAGIPVISMNSGSDVSKKLGCLMHVGQEEYDAGKGAGERMKAEGVKKGVCLNQEVGNVALDLRAKGFKDGRLPLG